MNTGPNMNYRLVQKAEPLGAPPASAVYTLLQEQLTYNEILKASQPLQERSRDDSMSSSLFDLTSLPNETGVDLAEGSTEGSAEGSAEGQPEGQQESTTVAGPEDHHALPAPMFEHRPKTPTITTTTFLKAIIPSQYQHFSL